MREPLETLGKRRNANDQENRAQRVEYLITHLLFPQKISRSGSSDIPNYLACTSAKS